MESDRRKADPPTRIRRWFQVRLRTLVFWIIPYAAIYAAVVSLIFSGDDAQRPVGTPGDVLYSLRMISWRVGEAMGAEITNNLVIVFTIAWIALPILSLSI